MVIQEKFRIDNAFGVSIKIIIYPQETYFCMHLYRGHYVYYYILHRQKNCDIQ